MTKTFKKHFGQLQSFNNLKEDNANGQVKRDYIMHYRTVKRCAVNFDHIWLNKESRVKSVQQVHAMVWLGQ